MISKCTAKKIKMWLFLHTRPVIFNACGEQKVVIFHEKSQKVRHFTQNHVFSFSTAIKTRGLLENIKIFFINFWSPNVLQKTRNIYFFCIHARSKFHAVWRTKKPDFRWKSHIFYTFLKNNDFLFSTRIKYARAGQQKNIFYGFLISKCTVKNTTTDFFLFSTPH